MNETRPQGAITEDARFELLMAAAAAERSNRPRALVVAACVLLVLALGYLLVSTVSRAAAVTRLAATRSEVRNLERVVNQLKELQATGTGDIHRAMNTTFGYIEKMAQSVGLPAVQVKSSEGTSGPEGFVLRSYRATVVEQDPEKLLQWINKVEAGDLVPNDPIDPTPGLQVGTIKLTPGKVLESGKVGWNLDVTFKRWERRE
jgi:hypothetical protein